MVPREASRAWSGLLKATLVRDGARTVEAVSMTFMHNDGYVVTIHGDDFIAAGSQRGLDSLYHTTENNFRRKTLGRFGPNCSQKSGKFFRRTVECADGAFWWKPDPRLVQECSALPEAKRPQRLARKTR